MKKLLVLFTIALSTAAHASIVSYLPNSKLPTELQDKVNQALDKNCSHLSNTNESSTTAEEHKIDQGVTDTYFTTTFYSSWYFDGQHPVGTYITVKSVEWSASNPSAEKLQVLEVSDSSSACQ